MAEVALEHLSKTYPNGVPAVRDLSLTIPAGELLVLVGPSGSGKSTILRLIAGLETPTGGAVRIGGRDVTRLPPRRRDVAMVFQKHSLYPHLSVYDNLAFGLRLRDRAGWRWLRRWFGSDFRRREAETDERVREAARLLELDELLNRKPGQLSGGQQQRAALGRALVRRPAVFLLDEPLSNLDWRLRTDLRRQLHLLQRRLQATMVYVTHDQSEALALGDRVVVLDGGVVRQADTPAGLYQRPRDRFVAGFIGWPPMNLLDGRLAEEGGRLCLQTAGHCLPVPPGWKPFAGREVTLGIRPTAITVGDAAGAARLTMEVALSEPQGDGVLLTLRRDGIELTAKAAAASAFASGQTVEVAIDMRHSYFFDRAGGLALERRDAEG